MASSHHDDYFGQDRDSYRLVRVKRGWLPEWTWWLVSKVDPYGEWVAIWLTTEADQNDA